VLKCYTVRTALQGESGSAKEQSSRSKERTRSTRSKEVGGVDLRAGMLCTSIFLRTSPSAGRTTRAHDD